MRRIPSWREYVNRATSIIIPLPKSSRKTICVDGGPPTGETAFARIPVPGAGLIVGLFCPAIGARVAVSSLPLLVFLSWRTRQPLSRRFSRRLEGELGLPTSSQKVSLAPLPLDEAFDLPPSSFASFHRARGASSLARRVGMKNHTGKPAARRSPAG